MLLALLACADPEPAPVDPPADTPPADTGGRYCGEGWPWYPDDDGDGWGNTRAEAWWFYCTGDVAPDGYAPLAHCYGSDLPPGYDDCGEYTRDCDDDDPAIHPLAEEIWYDGVDQDCDRESDHDADRDRHDRVEAGGGDCDDADEARSPDAPERCDGVDDDCDGAVDGPPCGDLASRADAEHVVALGVEEVRAWDLETLGDVDGDGLPDLLVTTRYDVDFVLARPFAAESMEDAIAAVRSETPSYVCSGPAGDLDGDGFADLWIIEYTDAADVSGIVPGPLAGTLTTASATWAQADFDVLTRAEVTGDGVPDVIADDCLADGPIPRGERIADRCRAEVPAGVQSAGDLDGDGLEDLVLVDPYGDDAGVTLYLAPFDGTTTRDDADGVLMWDPTSSPVNLVLPLGDVDGDGRGDLAASEGAGEVYVVLGPADHAVYLPGAWATIRGEPTSDDFGWTIHGPGDLDGDGLGDLVVGGWDEEFVSDDGFGSRAVWVLRGLRPGAWVAGTLGTKWRGPELGYASFTEGLVSGDLDGDGATELVFGLDGGFDAGEDALWLVRP